MNILFLPAYCRPEGAASSYLGKNRNEALIKMGCTLYAYAPVPTRGVPDEIRKIYKREKKNEVLEEGHFIIHRFNMYREGKNPVLRALRYFLCAIRQFNMGVFAKDAKKCSVMFILSTPPIQGAMAAMVKKCRRNLRFIYNLQDIFPDSLVGTGLTKKGGFLWKIGRTIENFTYRNADKIIVISEDFKKNIMAKGVPEEKIAVIYNWVDQDAVVDIPRVDNKLFDKYGLDRSKFYLCYSGNIGLTQNMDMLLEVMEELQSDAPDVQLVLIGDGAYRDQVVRRIGGLVCDDGSVRGTVLTNVTLLPFQPYEDISYVFSLGDVGLVISKPGVGANSVPSKTWSVMSASRPVLANFDENELRTIIKEHHLGIFTKAGDKVSFKRSILDLYHDRGLCRSLGCNGRKFVLDNLTKEVGAQKYVEVIMQFEND